MHSHKEILRNLNWLWQQLLTTKAVNEVVYVHDIQPSKHVPSLSKKKKQARTICKTEQSLVVAALCVQKSSTGRTFFRRAGRCV
jgi:hypothetical protein